MAGSTPIYGLPYPQASDLVANYPALGEDLAETLDEKLPTYAATAPSTPSVGQIWIDSDDDLGRVWTGSVWQLFSGAGPANFTDAATGTYTDTGIDYKYRTYTSSGTVTIDKAGLCDVLVLAGGGGGGTSPSAAFGGGGGGAGGHIYLTDYLVPVGTLTVTVGAGGAVITPGSESAISILLNVEEVRAKGGGQGIGNAPGVSGGSGGGGGQDPVTGLTGQVGGAGAVNTGFDGGTGAGSSTASLRAGGGGGGGSAVGGNATAGTGGVGGAGAPNSITGTSVTRAVGGTGGVGSTAGGSAGANTGNGGGGAGTGANGFAGGSGIVIIRVRTN